MKLNKPFLLNFVGFQILWLLCVQGNNIVALAALAIFLVVHAKWVAKVKSEWLHGLIFLLIGTSFETVLNTLGLITFSNTSTFTIGQWTIRAAPVWLLCLWVGFSTTLYHGMSWLAPRPLLQIILVSVSIPLTYYAGARFSGSSLSSPLWLPLLVITIFWLFVLPFGFRLRSWLQERLEVVHA